MVTYSKRTVLANTFGTLGYISCLFQWLFVGLLYLPLLLNNEQIKQFLLPEKLDSVEPVANLGPPSPWLIGIAAVFTIFMIVLTIVMLVRAPLTVAKTGRKVTTKTAHSIVPLIAHRPLSTKKKRLLTNQLVKIVKLSLVLLPFIMCLLSVFVTTALPSDVIIFASAILAIGSLVWFSAQYISARLLNVVSDKLV